jgi:hypothetical protein
MLRAGDKAAEVAFETKLSTGVSGSTKLRYGRYPDGYIRGYLSKQIQTAARLSPLFGIFSPTLNSTFPLSLRVYESN